MEEDSSGDRTRMHCYGFAGKACALPCCQFRSGKGKRSGSEGTQAAKEIDVKDEDLVGVAGTLMQQLDTSSSRWFVI